LRVISLTLMGRAKLPQVIIRRTRNKTIDAWRTERSGGGIRNSFVLFK
jgi:hypothetical protein